jgi:membrane fusion protein (multidrug efflux system)
VSLRDYFNPGQDMVNIENIETLKVDFRMSEIYAVQLKVGQTWRRVTTRPASQVTLSIQ